ncbi:MULTISPECIES: helix-turn-helix transcriptional regulator [unclassified Stenotrophomonas]|uniref:helix-turn-helix transcriptional regulator n=1 Tax=unclassified Stenotrophomonas TaxID=196198 RepID=UPI00211860CE|nr:MULTISPECIES: helix-turn-helix transcriptional regulator [unclassified Stenotrophomonas]
MAKRTPPVRPGDAKRIAALGERLRTARLARRMSQANLAERVGVDRTTIGKLEAGDAGTSLSTVLRVLSALGLERDIERIAADDALGAQLAASSLKRPPPRRVPAATGRASRPQGTPPATLQVREPRGAETHPTYSTDHTGPSQDATGDRYTLVAGHRAPRLDAPAATPTRRRSRAPGSR